MLLLRKLSVTVIMQASCLVQVINDYYTLANPYPSRVVAIINQTSQIVDETGRPVPLSEVSPAYNLACSCDASATH